MLDHVLDSFSRAEVLQGLAFVQARVARLAVMQQLLQDRLAQLTSAPAKHQDGDELLTADEVKDRLKLIRARVYELLRLKELPSVRIGERQVRVRRTDLDQYLTARQVSGKKATNAGL